MFFFLFDLKANQYRNWIFLRIINMKFSRPNSQYLTEQTKLCKTAELRDGACFLRHYRICTKHKKHAIVILRSVTCVRRIWIKRPDVKAVGELPTSVPLIDWHIKNGSFLIPHEFTAQKTHCRRWNNKSVPVFATHEIPFSKNKKNIISVPKKCRSLLSALKFPLFECSRLF